MTIAEIRAALLRVVGGAWINTIPLDGFEGVALKVRGLDSPAADKVRTRLHAAGASIEEIADEVIVAIAIDWNLEEAGEPVECHAGTVRELLSDDVLGPHFRNAYAYAATAVGALGTAKLETA